MTDGDEFLRIEVFREFVHRVQVQLAAEQKLRETENKLVALALAQAKAVADEKLKVAVAVITILATFLGIGLEWLLRK